MKRTLSMTALAFFIMLSASFKNTANAQVRAGVSINYQTFYDELDPYGRWMDYPEYGYVWVPDAGPDFRPYSTNGHWVWSDDYEWMWVSDYDWGWAPFHYGRWLDDPYYGWMWVPGYEWSPAWVAWRDGGDYYGWAPLRPGINISVGFNLGGYDCPVDYWCFAPRRYISSPRIYDYCVPRRSNVTIINQTTIINNYNYNRNVYRTGPGRRDAERYTGRINSVRFRDASGPGRGRTRGNEVSIYRPNVQRDNDRSFQPRRVQNFDRNRNDNGVTRNGNNLPGRRDGNGNGGRFDRGNNSTPNNIDRGNNNGITERRRNMAERDRSETYNNGNNNNNNPRPERPNRQFEPRNNPTGNNPTGETTPFERGRRNRDNNNGNNDNNRERPNGGFERNTEPREARPIERRRIETQPMEQRRDQRMERREIFNQNNNNRERQMRTEQPQQQPQRQMEQPRRFEQPQRQEQPQQRQFERRNDNNNGGGGGGGDRGGHGRRGR